MEPETKELINSYPEMTEEQAKLLFIRQSATKAFENGGLEEATKSIAKEIVGLIVLNMSKQEIGLHIANLEKARSFLASFTQGLMIGYVKEEEPRIKAKREKERRDRIASKVSGGDKKVNELIEFGRQLALGMGKVEESKPKTVASKVECPNCHKETFSLKFHKC